MDNTLLGVVLVAAVALLVTIIAWVISWYRQRELVQQAGQWVPVEVTIESGALEGTHESGKVVLPTFAFSYQVSEHYYSGRFSVRANLSKELAESMVAQMIGRKLLLRYDPDHPELWFIPDKLIDGYKVEQKIGSHVIHDYSPRLAHVCPGRPFLGVVDVQDSPRHDSAMEPKRADRISHTEIHPTFPGSGADVDATQCSAKDSGADTRTESDPARLG